MSYLFNLEEKGGKTESSAAEFSVSEFAVLQDGHPI